MLNNQFQTEEELNAKLSRRVTPDEFSAAVIAIQKRRAEEERLMSETVAVDEVVRDLNIDASPEEILAEVEAQRRVNSKPRVPRDPAQDSSRLSVPPMASVGVTSSTKSIGRRRVESIITNIVVAVAIFGVFVGLVGRQIESLVDSHINEPLSAVRTGHHVSISNSELDRLINGTPSSEITVTDHEDLFNAPWTIVNEDGKFYIWAYAEEPLDLTRSPINLYNDLGDVPTDHATDLTVPISSLSGATVLGEGDDGTIDVKKLVLDGHKDDDWATN